MLFLPKYGTYGVCAAAEPTNADNRRAAATGAVRISSTSGDNAELRRYYRDGEGLAKAMLNGIDWIPPCFAIETAPVPPPGDTFILRIVRLRGMSSTASADSLRQSSACQP
jgi:hypothetical protein